MAHSDACLLHRSGRERRESDHIAGGVDRRRRRSVILIHLNITALIQCNSCAFQAQLFNHSPTASREQRRLCLKSLTGLKRDSDTVIGAFDLRHALAEIESNAEVCEALPQTL